MKRAGFTLPEVLVVLAVLGVGVLSVLSLQVSALRGDARAERLEAGVALARAEMELWRSAGRRVLGRGTCVTASAHGMACEVEVTPCAITARGGVNCSPGIPAGSLDRVDVRVTWWEGQDVTLHSLVFGGAPGGAGGSE